METKPQKSTQDQKQTPENFVKDIRRQTRRIYSSEQKILIVMEALRGEDSVAAICRKHGIQESMFYKWNKEFLEAGKKRLAGDTAREATSDEVVEVALEHPVLSPRELAVKLTDEQRVFISESSVYRILKAKGLVTTPAHILLSASNEFADKPRFVHQLWQTDFTYFKVLGWGWYYLSTILDDYSRFIVHWELCKTMKAEDVQRTVETAMRKAGLQLGQRPKLLSDNGACYVAQELKTFLENKGITPVHGKPCHPQTQGKIERYHRSMKNVVKLEHYYCPEELNGALKDFVNYYNHQRYHESLDNVTPAGVYFGRREQILRRREKIKQQTLKQRRKRYIMNKPII